MSAFDDRFLEEAIRRRIGEPGTVTRVEPGTRSAMGMFRNLAECFSGNGMDLVMVTAGIPGHFSLQGRDRQTVVFHERQVEVCAFLHGITFERRMARQLQEDVFEGTVLRLIAEFLLQGGHGDQALSTLAKARRVQGGMIMHGPTIAQLQEIERDERYLVEWFFALGHEIGHGLSPELASSLKGFGCMSTGTAAEIVDNLIDVGSSVHSRDHLKDIVRRADAGEGPRSHAGAQVVRDEAVADLFSLVCLCEAWGSLCADQAGRDYEAHVLLLEALVSMSSVMIIEQCRIMAGWFSSMSHETEQQPLAMSRTALAARMNLLHAALRDAQVLEFLMPRFPSLQALTRLDEEAFLNGMRYLESWSLRMGAPFGRARAFLSSPEMRDPRLLQTYFEEVSTDRDARFEAVGFLRTARHLDSPMLGALRDVAEGGIPPIVTSTR